MIKSFAEDIWILEGEVVKMYGFVPFVTRMTIVKLQNGSLWIHSPLAEFVDFSTIDELGRVAHIIAPNKIHSLGVDPWRKRYPEAKVWGSPEFNKRHEDIVLDGVISDEQTYPWQDDIDHQVVNGHAILDEVAFLHKKSRSLILTDLIQKHDPARETWFWKVLKGWAGILGQNGSTPRDVRLSFKDKQAARQSIDTILKWDFENLVISHGFCLKGNAKKEVTRCFDWLMI
ncbi:MAG: DUF4336 domain-containing protein [Methylocystaceae bacterium]|nr:DUF4336 domain-containing protein [Methylocystaceae bacterium]